MYSSFVADIFHFCGRQKWASASHLKGYFFNYVRRFPEDIQLKNLPRSNYRQSVEWGSVGKIQRLFTIFLRREINISEKNTGKTTTVAIKSAPRKDMKYSLIMARESTESFQRKVGFLRVFQRWINGRELYSLWGCHGGTSLSKKYSATKD